MLSTQRNRLHCLVFIALCLLAATALMSISASAQASHAGQKAKTPDSTTSQKDFRFEVVSIRPVKPGMENGTTLSPTPDGYHATLAVWQMIKAAYVPGYFENWGDTSLLNTQKWLYGNVYEINARVANKDLDAWQHQGGSRELLRSALRTLLKERCKLVIHMQPKELPDYKLVIAKTGPQLKENAPDPKLPPYGGKLADGGYMALTKQDGRRMLELYFHAATMNDLCWYLNLRGEPLPPIHNDTGLNGRYDFKLVRTDSSGDFGEATIWQLAPLGLKLNAGKYQGFSIVIDHVESPTAN